MQFPGAWQIDRRRKAGGGLDRLRARPRRVVARLDPAEVAEAEPAALDPSEVVTEAATYEPSRPVGTKEPETGRLIVQPSENPRLNQALATAAMPEFRAGLEAAVKEVEGAKLAAVREAKKPRRLTEKIEDEGQPAETVSDYGAAQITVDSPQARDAVIDAVKRRFPRIREEDNFDRGDPEYHYRSYTMQLQMPNGSTEELQIVPREVLRVNPSEHKDYVAARDAQAEGKDADREVASARAKNDLAMAKFDRRNGGEASRLRAASEEEKSIRARTVRDGPRLVAAYIRDNAEHGVVTIAADRAKGMFPEFRADPVTGNALVGASAQALTWAVIETALSRPPDPRRRVVEIATGSPASGKTFSQQGAAPQAVGIRLEWITDEAGRDSRLIRQIIASGREPLLAWIYVDDPAKTVNRMIARARRIGRTVPLSEMARMYAEVPLTIARLHEEFGDALPIAAFNNSGSVGSTQLHTQWEDVSRLLDAAMAQGVPMKRMDDELQKLRSDGKVSDAIYAGAKRSASGFSASPGHNEPEAQGLHHSLLSL